MVLASSQYDFLMVVATISGLLSILGSTVIGVASLRSILRSRTGNTDSSHFSVNDSSVRETSLRRRLSSIVGGGSSRSNAGSTENLIFQSLIFALSATDIFASSTNILHRFLLPSYTQDYGLLWSFGTQRSCTTMGFIFTFSVILVTFYNTYLSGYFLVRVRYNRVDRDLSRYLVWLHVVAFTVALAISVPGLFIEGAYGPRMYRNICSYGDCEIGKLDDCDLKQGIKWWLGWIQVSTMGLLSLASLIMTCIVYFTVRSVIARNKRYDFVANTRASSTSIPPANGQVRFSVNQDSSSMTLHPEDFRSSVTNTINPSASTTEGRQPTTIQTHSQSEDTSAHLGDSSTSRHFSIFRRSSRLSGAAADQQSMKNERLKAVQTQAILYSLCYWNSFFWIIVSSMASVDDHKIAARESEPMYFAFSVLNWFFVPLQGFLNFIVYTRPRYLQHRKTHTRIQAMKNAISFEPVNENTHLSTVNQSPSVSRRGSSRQQQQQQRIVAVSGRDTNRMLQPQVDNDNGNEGSLSEIDPQDQLSGVSAVQVPVVLVPTSK